MRTSNIIIFTFFLVVTPFFLYDFPSQIEESHFPTEFIIGPKWATFSIYSKGLSQLEVQRECEKGNFQLEKPREKPSIFLGCAVISFALRQCHFVYVKTIKEAYLHEKLHCKGFDHKKGNYRGEISLSKHFDIWNNSIKQETLILQQRGIPDKDVVKIVAERAIIADLAVLKRLGWPSTPQEAKELGWQKEENSYIKS